MRRLIALLAVLLSAPVAAETNLAWVPASSSNRNVGSWQIPGATSLVLSGSSWSGASIAQFGPLASTAPVYACTVDVPIGQTDGCPTPGNYSQERFIPKSQVNQGAPPPPPDQPPPPVWAEGEATLSWDAPTVRTDGSPITGVLTYRIETDAGVLVANDDASPYLAIGLPAGTHCWRVLAIEGGNAGAPSNVACKTIVEDEPPPPPPPPPPPVIVVVPNAPSVPYAVVYGITSAGGRSSTVLGFAPVGAPCSGSRLFGYRSQDYYRLPQSSVIWATGVTPTVNAAAACR